MGIDVFLPSIDFSWEGERLRVRVTNESGWFDRLLSAESSAVFERLFFRGKDVVELERLIAVRPELDRDYVRRWIVEMMSEDDERTRTWDQLVVRFTQRADSKITTRSDLTALKMCERVCCGEERRTS